MNGAAIKAVTDALNDRLTAALATSGVPGGVFVGPLDDPNASGATLILFLYRIVPNASLRNREHVVASSNPPPAAIVFRNSLPLELHYLVTVGTDAAAGATNQEPSLTALGYAMQALQIDPELAGQKLGYETAQVSLEPLATDEMSRIWALFPTANYRTSVAYVASPVWIDPPQPAAVAAPVVDDQLFAGGNPLPVTP